jgi:hypothetical protein
MIETEGSLLSREQIAARTKSTDTIVRKIVKAAEAKKPRLRYVAAWTLAVLLQLMRIFGT